MNTEKGCKMFDTHVIGYEGCFSSRKKYKNTLKKSRLIGRYKTLNACKL